MDITVESSFLKGTIRAPASKSVVIRVLAAGLLSRGETRVRYPSTCDDALAARQVIRSLGAEVSEGDNEWLIKGGISLLEDVLDVGESGLTARLFTPLAAVLSQPMTITGRGSLMKRPMGMMTEPLQHLGVTVETNKGYLPVTVHGPLRGGNIRVDGSKSSQFLTGLLMSLPLAEKDSTIRVDKLRSVPYIDLTLRVMEHFGVKCEHSGYERFFVPANQEYQAAEMDIEGDWSGAAFLLVAAAISGELKVTGLDPESRQADRRIMEALGAAGVEADMTQGYVYVKKSDIHPFFFDITHCPDLAPPLVCLAAYAQGETVIRGAGRLYEKESNRALTLQEEAGKLGVRIDLKGDTMVIHGGRVTGGESDAHQDHRIAMFAATMAFRAENPVTIHGKECVSKSYPDFFQDLKKLGGNVYE